MDNDLHRIEPNTSFMRIHRCTHQAANCLHTMNRGGNNGKILRKTGIENHTFVKWQRMWHRDHLWWRCRKIQSQCQNRKNWCRNGQNSKCRKKFRNGWQPCNRCTLIFLFSMQHKDLTPIQELRVFLWLLVYFDTIQQQSNI